MMWINMNQYYQTHLHLINSNLMALMLSVTIGLAGCSQQNMSPEEYIQEAKDLNAKGKHREAIIQLRNVLQQKPNHPQANWLLAETYLAMNNPFLAETALLKAREGGVSNQVLKYPLARSLLSQGKAAEALKMAAPDSGDSLAQKIKLIALQGDSLLAMGNYDEGCARYTAILELKRDSSTATLGLSRCAAARQDYVYSRELTNNALRYDPKDSNAWLQLGHIERGVGHFSEAETAYGKALELAPRDVDALLGRAMTRLRASKFDLARADIKQAQEAAPNNPVPTHLLGVESHLRGKYKEAKIHFQRVLKTLPGYLPSIYWQGLTDLHIGNIEQAAKALSLYSSKQPNDLLAKIVLATAEARLGNIISAEKSLKALTKLGLSDPKMLGMTGLAFLNVGNATEAQHLLRLAVTSNPKDFGLKLALTESYRQLQQHEAAAATVREALILAPKSSLARQYLVQSLIAQNKKDDARKEIAEARRLDPKNTMFLFLMAGMQLQDQDWPGARKSFEEMLKIDPNSSNAHLNLTRLDLREGRLDKAQARLHALYERNKKNMTALLGLASLAYASGDLKTQRTWLETAIKSDPRDMRPVMRLAENALATGSNQQALMLATQANNAAPNNPESLKLLADIQYANRDYANAQFNYKRLVVLQPESSEAYMRLAAASNKAGFVNEARLALLKAIAIQPGDIAARIALTNHEIHEKKYMDAHQQAAAVKRGFKELSVGYMLDGDIYLAKRNLVEAQKQYELGLQIQPNSLLLLRLADVLQARGDSQGAESHMRQWLSRNPDDMDIRLRLATHYARQNKYDAAIDEFDAMLKRRPDQPALLNDLAWLLMKKGNLQRAMSIAERAYKINPETPAIQDTLGWALLQNGRVKQGLGLLEKASQAQPDNPVIRYHFAAALARSGDMIKAREQLSLSLKSRLPFTERPDAEALMQKL